VLKKARGKGVCMSGGGVIKYKKIHKYQTHTNRKGSL
jgi:hypothetical protein